MKKRRRGLWEETKHYLNALHVYVFLCKFTKNRKKARALAKRWEKTVFHRILYVHSGDNVRKIISINDGDDYEQKS